MKDRALDRLFRRFRDRHDGAALAAVFDATARELLEASCHLIRDPHEAEDLVQATFLTAIRKARDYDGSSPVKAWLYGILWREAAKARRTAARAVDPGRLSSRRMPEPIEGLLAQELPAAIERALRDLPQRYREVLEPWILEGRRAEEIAVQLQRSPGTVRSQIHRGLERLRRALPAGAVAALPSSMVRGLPDVRGQVLQAAGYSPILTATAAPVFTLVSTTGGLLMSKGMLIGIGAAAALAVTMWILTVDPFSYEGPPVAAATPQEGRPSGLEASSLAGDPAVPAAEQRDLAGSEEAAAAGPDATALSLDAEIEFWLARFDKAPDDWRHGLRVAAEIAELPPDEGLAIMTGVWLHLSVAVREQALKPFVFGDGHEHAVKLLHLAATDESLSVQGRAFSWLRSIAFVDFTEDYEAYLTWSDTNRDRPLAEVLNESGRAFVGRLATLPYDQVPAALDRLRRGDWDMAEGAGIDLRRTIREAGGEDLIGSWLQAGDRELAREALAWARELQPGEDWMRSNVLPILKGEAEPGMLSCAAGVFGRRDCAWAVEPLTELMLTRAGRQVGDGYDKGAKSIAQALGGIGDPRAIPAMIAMIEADGSSDSVYGVGYYGLGALTGVIYDESHDGAWWRAWWEANQGRLPESVQGVAIPVIK